MENVRLYLSRARRFLVFRTKGLTRKNVPLNRLDRSRKLFVQCLTAESITALRRASGPHHEQWVRTKQPKKQDSQSQHYDNIQLRLCRTCQKRGSLDCCTIGGSINSAESDGDSPRRSDQSRTSSKVSEPLKFLECNDKIRANFQRNSVRVVRKF